MGSLHFIQTGVGRCAAEKLAQAIIQIENHGDLGETLQRPPAFAFQQFERGKRHTGPLGELRLGPAARLPVVADPLADLTDQTIRVSDLKSWYFVHIGDNKQYWTTYQP